MREHRVYIKTGNLNVERLRLWIDALRSGEYRQGQYALKSIREDGEKPSHCCLGVACEVYIREEGQGSWDEGPTGRFYFVRTDGGYKERELMPVEVAEWFGFVEPGEVEDNFDPYLPTKDLGDEPFSKGVAIPNAEEKATVLNDESRWGFEEISWAVEKLIEMAEEKQKDTNQGES